MCLRAACSFRGPFSFLERVSRNSAPPTDFADVCKNLIRLDVRAEERQLVALELDENPLQEAQKKSLDRKLGTLDLTGRDLLRYLLANGESEGKHIDAAALFPDTYMGSLLEFVEKSGLVLHRTERVGNIEANRFWKVNPEFGPRLQALLFPRPDEEGPAKFRI